LGKGNNSGRRGRSRYHGLVDAKGSGDVGKVDDLATSDFGLAPNLPNGAGLCGFQGWLNKKKKGSFGQKETRHDEVTDVVNIGSQIKTGGDLSLVSGGNQLYQGAKLESGKDLTLDSGGSITFEAVKDLHQESHEKSSNSLAWTSAKGKGNTDETFRQSELVAQGKLAIKAVDGLNIDIKQIDQKSVSQTIDAMVLADPQLAWLKDAEKRGDVDCHKVQEVHESFKYSHSGLGQGAMLAIIIIVTALTAGAASAAIGTAANATVASGTAMAAAGTSAAGTAVAAGWGNVALTAIATSAAGGAAISTINNKGNIGAVIKDVTSSESLKGYVVAGVSGGIGGANIGVRLAVNSALQTVVNGGKFKDNLSQAVIGLVADMMAGAIYEQVGTSLLGSGLPTKVAVHAIVGGLIGEAAGGDFATSALAAGANEALIQMVGDKIFPGVAHEQVLAMTSQLLGMTVAAAAGGSDKDQQVAGWEAQQATVNNYLGHEQKEALAKKLDATCHGNIQCIQVDHFAQRPADRGIQRRLDAPVPRSLEREDVFDAVGQRLVVQAPDPFQRHVERTVRTGCGQAVAVHHIGFAGDLGELGNFRQCRTMLRVNRAAIAVEQTGSAEKPGAVPHTRQGHAQFSRALQEVDQCIVGLERGAITATHHQQIQLLYRHKCQNGIGANDQAQVADYLPFDQAKGFGGKQFGPQQVGGDDRIQCLGKRRQREMLQQQEPCPGTDRLTFMFV
jgi:hypothetical protein